MHPKLLFLVGVAAFFAACQSPNTQGSPSSVTAEISAPVAEKRPAPLEIHGDVRIDNYYWLNQRDDPKVLAYLEAENAYGRHLLRHTDDLQEELFKELVGRMKEDDSSVPVRMGDFWYYTRFEVGQSYPTYCRKTGSLAAPEEVLLDMNSMAAGFGYYSIGTSQPSPDHSKLAFSVDDVGRRIYDLHVKDLATGKTSDTIEGCTGQVVWAEDGRHFFYTRRDLKTLRAYQIWRHELGTAAASDVLVFEEQDEEYSCSVGKTRSKRFLTITSSQTLASEVRILEADHPKGEFRVVLPRKRGHEYRLDHHGDSFFLLTNHDAPNFRLVQVPVNSPSMTNWQSLVPHRADVLIEDVNLFQDYMVVTQRRNGLRELRVHPMDGGSEYSIEFDDPTYSLGGSDNPEFVTQTLRVSYSSPTTPQSVYDYHLGTRARELKKRDAVLGGFDRANYACDRIWATVQDGTRVPISLVYRLPFSPDGTRPLLLYGYGSYGSSMDAGFNPSIVSLLDRGVVYAIAHIRGGQEMGRHWYEGGKLLNKRNTFTDFIACGEHLAKTGYGDGERMACMGGSAGGLLVGAVMNMRPDLFRSAVAAVPFVDVVTTMLDASIPLTTFEWDEWGNPEDKTFYDYMLSYSPYDQVAAKDYPNILITTGLHDSQVQYFEPAKWVAKLRDTKTDDNLLVFRCEMEAGHGGASGRYQRRRETALIYAFLLSTL